MIPGTAVVCALDRSAVGVDVQGWTPYHTKFRRILSESERKWIEEQDCDRRFTSLWTRKEAYGKALGVGIGYEMAKTEFSGSFDEPAAFADWLLWTVQLPRFALSVCAKHPLEIQSVSVQQLLQFAQD
jgi:phosphopantetheinyl transferase